MESSSSLPPTGADGETKDMKKEQMENSCSHRKIIIHHIINLDGKRFKIYLGSGSS